MNHTIITWTIISSLASAVVNWATNDALLVVVQLALVLTNATTIPCNKNYKAGRLNI